VNKLISTIKKNPLVTILVGLMIGVAAWTLHSMLTDAIRDLLLHFDIVNTYIQNTIVIIVVAVVVVLLYGVKKLKDIVTG